MKLLLAFIESASAPRQAVTNEQYQAEILSHAREQTRLAQEAGHKHEQERQRRLRYREASGQWNPLDYGDRF